MDLFIKLFQSDIGLLSAFTIGFIIAMAIYLYFWVKKQAAKEEQER
ncbi:MAG: DUF3149 domain-containing protein [Neisseria sp.]|nr:DUF3149 domain-containing protein [Neisseria sp.]